MSDLVLSILGLILGWFLIGTASAFLIAVAFFGIREEKNLEENNDDL